MLFLVKIIFYLIWHPLAINYCPRNKVMGKMFVSFGKTNAFSYLALPSNKLLSDK
jgi:hypothetical protein